MIQLPSLSSTAVRFILNGLFATGVHYLALVALMEIARVPSAGLANGMAAIAGITVSYLGNRALVFRSAAPHTETLPRFLAVYSLAALVHGAVLGVWSDWVGLPYQPGFVIATGLCVGLTYFANKLIVFRAGT